ncbi:DUF6489 family protein [Hyphobacterium sp.]|uniref:DUF6489 family protein n=1 Tax=Hyphobacterium sp. TaxID=2004662 RepID=UPI003BAACC0B
MKVKIDIDCTPQEARAFLGLPDVAPVNELMVKEMTKRMQENMASLEPDVLMRNWMSFGGQMQDQFLSLMRQAGQTGKD